MTSSILKTMMLAAALLGAYALPAAAKPQQKAIPISQPEGPAPLDVLYGIVYQDQGCPRAALYRDDGAVLADQPLDGGSLLCSKTRLQSIDLPLVGYHMQEDESGEMPPEIANQLPETAEIQRVLRYDRQRRR